MTQTFPKEIQVRYEQPANDDPYLMVGELEDAEDGDKVATYKLVRVNTLRVNRRLE